MLFNSGEYLLFLPIVFIVYWSLNRHLKSQNLILLVASYLFYGLWDYRFLTLIFISSLSDFVIGKCIYSSEKRSTKQLWVLLTVVINIGLLAVFKYHGFFSESFSVLMKSIGVKTNDLSLNIILPVGISFYTFQTLSYSLDIYKEKLKPTNSIVNFFAFVAFFPQLVAGPIERASKLLPQIETHRSFNSLAAKDGLRQILWGLFKKAVLADNCAFVVNTIFANYMEYNGIVLFIGAVFFVFQIYFDFSGYSDVAIGSARLLGINLSQNFSAPYFSVNTTEFWRRWHISLSTWFRDYVFVPISLKYRRSKNKMYLATFCTFILLGLWHGDNWTFIFFGFMQALALSIEIYSSKWRTRYKKNLKFKAPYLLVSWLLTMIFWTCALVVFRSESLSDSLQFFTRMLNVEHQYILQSIHELGISLKKTGIVCILISVTMIIEWIQRNRHHGLELLENFCVPVLRWTFYLVVISLIYTYSGPSQDFVYFQF